MPAQVLLRTAARVLVVSILIVVTTAAGARSQKDDPADEGVHPEIGSLDLSVEPASEWTGLFRRNRGWLAADGIYSIALAPSGTPEPDRSVSRVLFYFGDTVWGRAEHRRAQPGWQFLNNSVAVLRGHAPDSIRIRFYAGRDSSGNARSVFVPHTAAASPEHWYWLGDGFTSIARAGTTYIFADRMARLPDEEGPFNFRLDGVALIAIPPDGTPPFRRHRQMDTPLYAPPTESRHEIHYGAGVLVERRDGRTARRTPEETEAPSRVYVYGIRGPAKELVLGRVPAGRLTDFDRWRYWDGTSWHPDLREAATLARGVSDELSVTKIAENRYVLVYQREGISPVTAARIAPSPKGPFGPEHVLHRCPEASSELNGLDLYCYNAKAHPALSDPGELVVSYNVNSFTGGLDGLARGPTYYRPRFLRLEVGLASPEKNLQHGPER